MATSIKDPTFLSESLRVLEASGRILVLVRYVYGAGSSDFFLLESADEFRSLIDGRRSRDSITVMKSFRVIDEGAVTEDFLSKLIRTYPEGENWILIGPDNFEHTLDWAFAESKSELKEELEGRLGREVCIVEEPDFVSDSYSINAYVPDPDGEVRPGAY